MNQFLLRTVFLLVVCLSPLVAMPEATAEVTSGRGVTVEAEAVVTHIDLETRHVTLQEPGGESFTVTAPEKVVKLEDVSVGDTLRVIYTAAIEGEVREPTEEELAEPWVVLEDAEVGEVGGQPVVGGARVVRAVCTVEGMNRLTRTATILDPRGQVHVIGDVEPSKMEGVTLGQTVVVVYEEAMAMTLEPVDKGAE